MAKSLQTSDAQMELMDHLAELRVRLFRAALYLVAGMIVAYNVYDTLFTLFSAPIQPILAAGGSSFIYTNVADPFLMKMQVAFIGGLTFAFPFITLELWGFIEPALTPEERKPIVFLAPFSVLLFFAGVLTAYASLPMCYGWMASFLVEVDNSVLYQDPKAYILLTAKILLAFGIGFELPVILLFLARLGIITAELMVKYWRQATVGLFFAGAILTPSNDPVSMLMMAIPLTGLYLLSIWLVKLFEPKEGQDGPPLSSLLLVSLAPVVILGASSFLLYKSNVFAPRQKSVRSVKQVEAQVEKGQAATRKTLSDIQSEFGSLVSRVEAVEKENAALREKNAELEARLSQALPTPAPPAPTPQPFVNPEGGAPTP